MVLLRRNKAEKLFRGRESRILFWICKSELSIGQVLSDCQVNI